MASIAATVRPSLPELAAMKAAGATVAAMRAAGASVGQLRQLRISPAELRAGGFSLEEMKVQLGAHLLREAGFTPAEMRSGGVTINEMIGSGLSAEAALAAGFTLPELMAVATARLLRESSIPLRDFVPVTPYWRLRALGFSAAELDSAGASHPPPVTPPKRISSSMLLGPEVVDMHVGQSFTIKGEGPSSSSLEVEVKRVSSTEAASLLARVHEEWLTIRSSYGYDGSGCTCPACGCALVLVEKRASSDGSAGVESGLWTCERAECGIVKRERYEGYGTIFWGWEALAKECPG